MRLSLELKALTTHPRRCRSDVTVAKIMARILSKYAVSSCLQVIHSADARSFDEGQVSPPATEKANGKLLAPKTTTGPRGRNRERMSGLGAGLRPESARSIRAATHDPSSAT